MNDTTADLEQRAGSLKPCPICGDKPKRNGRFQAGGVLCAGPNDGFPSHRVQTYGATQEEADEAWNERADQAAFRDAERVAEGAGFVLVPREPTEAMVEACGKADAETWGSIGGMYRAMWSAMLAAAPTLQPASASDSALVERAQQTASRLAERMGGKYIPHHRTDISTVDKSASAIKVGTPAKPADLLAHLRRIPMTEWVWADAEMIFATLEAAALTPDAGQAVLAERDVIPVFGGRPAGLRDDEIIEFYDFAQQRWNGVQGITPAFMDESDWWRYASAIRTPASNAGGEA